MSIKTKTMTDEQFALMMDKLEEINSSILLITTKDTGKGIFGLSDVYSEISSVASAVSDVETAVGRVKTAVEGIDLG